MHINPIRVLIVDDSSLFLSTLAKSMGKDAGLCVVGSASCTADAERAVRLLKPDAVILAASPRVSQTAGMIARLDPDGNLFFLVVEDHPQRFSVPLRKGNIDFARKPVSRSRDDLSTFCNEICVKIKISAKHLSAGVGAAPSRSEKNVRSSPSAPRPEAPKRPRRLSEISRRGFPASSSFSICLRVLPECMRNGSIPSANSMSRKQRTGTASSPAALWWRREESI